MGVISPLKAGDVAFTPVTNHPDFPKEFHVGDSCIFRERDVAERIATAWNSYGGEWEWFVKEIILLEKRPDEEIPEKQLPLW